MKIAKLLFALSCLLSTTFLGAQSSVILKDATMSISGTSSLHDWTSSVTEVNGKGNLILKDGELKDIENLTVTVPVISIKSTKGKVMDNKTYEALKSEAHPTISYQLTDVKSIEKTAAGFQVKTTGKLTIAGTTKAVDITVDGKLLSDGGIKFSGSRTVKMSEFNMEAPTALLGTIKTGDEVTINFTVTLSANRI